MSTKIDKIVVIPEYLKQVSRPTTMQEVMDLNLITRLKAALKTAWVGGSGLTAIQIGVPVKFGLIINGDQEIYLINPEIISTKPKFPKDWKVKNEGCLSVPERWSAVKRATKIKYISDGKQLQARGVLAHIIQHEVDHMNGVLNVDVAEKSWGVLMPSKKG